MGTTLDTDILKLAYTRGYFPMPHPETQEILWFNPDPRAILPLGGFHVSRSLRRQIAHGGFRITRDQCFAAVMHGCATTRKETWINEEFQRVYVNLFREGHAHSLEVWHDASSTQLAGGVYGVAMGGVFFAESMFHRVADASKVALYHLTEYLREQGFAMMEVQFLTPHLKSLGAVELPASKYLAALREALRLKPKFLSYTGPINP